jgi:hypothetical protein
MGGLDNLLPYDRINDCEGGPPMGRGRSKAKETKVARDLKYSNPDMDLERLAKELHGEVDGNKSVENNDTYTNDNNKNYK